MELPDFEKAWDYENAFWLSAQPTRLSKVLAQYELFKSVLERPGALVECGVFKGASLVRLAMLRELLTSADSRRIVAFDTFDKFPVTEYTADVSARADFIAQAGDTSISTEQLCAVLDHAKLQRNITLVPGDITDTVPSFVEENPALRIALLNIDTDIFEPAVTILEHLYERVVPGGVVILDDYGVFPGETHAAEQFFAGRGVRVERFPWAPTPCFVTKPDTT